MTTMKTFLCGSFLLVMILLSGQCNAQLSKRDQRAFRERGTDSAWIYNPAFARTRLYIGTTRVTANEFENTMRTSDAEVEALIGGAWRKLNTSRFLSWGAGATFLTGWLVINANQNNYNNNRTNNKVSTTGIILLSTGLVLEGVALGFGIESNMRYRNGIRLFNQKAKSGSLKPPQLNAGITNHGLGLMLKI